jgi:hypothetical protein
VVIVLAARLARFVGLNPAKYDGFLKAIKIRNTNISFEGEVKSSATCRKILPHVKDPCGV